MLKTKQTGFTIVELLIVIVVIGILAAITVVAFNGVQEKAKNTQRATTAAHYQKIISSYITEYGAYPVATGVTTTYCLGEGYPDLNDNGTFVDCFATNNIKWVSAALNAELSKVATLPDYDKTMLMNGTVGQVGIAYRGILIDGQPGVGIFYWLKGPNVDCGTNDILTSITGANNYTISDSARFSSSTSEITACIAAVPDPAKL